MINGITQSGRYVTVSYGNNNLPYVPSNSNNPIQGMIRVNNQDMQVFDGSSWITITQSYGTVGLTGEAESLLDWARKKRDEEMAWESLAKENQAVKIALDNLEQARRQLDITAKLAREYDTETTS
jgi:hypothetical protein